MLDSPYRLTALIIVGGLLSSAGFLASSLRSVDKFPFLLFLSLAFVVFGLISMLWAGYMLREGTSNERWPADTVASFRRITGHPVWTGITALLLVAMLVALTKGRQARPIFWGVFCLLQMQTQITNGFARPRKPGTPGPRLDWSQVGPLRSEHWGER